MNASLDRALCEKYPKIFAQRNLGMDKTCMCWGFDHGDGWYGIIDSLCNTIQQHLDHPPSIYQKTIHTRISLIVYKVLYMINQDFQLRVCQSKFGKTWLKSYSYKSPQIFQVEATQVKEKYGTLRFYTQGGDEYIQGAIDMAEVLSYYTCEECGTMDPNKIGRISGMKTICVDCVKDSHLKDAWKPDNQKEQVNDS